VLIDSHCHLAGSEFASDLTQVIERARGQGLASALVILAAEDEAERGQATEVGRLWPAARFAVGVHPHVAATCASDSVAAVQLVERAVTAGRRVCAIGEIGLDYHYDWSPRPVQREVFRRQVQLARRLRLPIVVHTREADEDTLQILADERAAEVGGVLHCFTGDRKMARRSVDLGFHLSLSGIVTFPRADELRDVARMVPLDRLLVETDSPYLAPVPHRGRRNEPANLVNVIRAIATARDVAVEVIAQATSENFERLFGPVTSSQDSN
jgi:TatD DNase family protein